MGKIAVTIVRISFYIPLVQELATPRELGSKLRLSSDVDIIWFLGQPPWRSLPACIFKGGRGGENRFACDTINLTVDRKVIGENSREGFLSSAFLNPLCLAPGLLSS